MLNFVDTVYRQVGIRQRSLARRCRMGRATELVFILTSGAVLSLGGAAEAQTWDGGGADAFWNTGTNWNADAVPANGGAVIINGAGGANANPNVNAATNNVASTAISGGTVTVGSILNSGTVTVSTGGTLTINAGGEVRGSSTPTDTALTVSGGTLTNNGTITGTLAVSGGTATNAGVVTGAITVSGGTLDLNAGSNIDDTEALTVNGGTLNVNLVESVGTLSGTGGTISVVAPATLTVVQAANGSFAGSMTGNGLFIKEGASTLTLTGDSTHTGSLDIDAGGLAFTGAGATDKTDIDVVAGTLTSDGGAFDTGAGIDVSGTSSFTITGSESIAVLNLASTATATLTGASTTLTLSGPGTPALDGVIDGSGGLTIAGGAATTTAVNTYTGATSVTGGTLNITGTGSVASTAVSTSGGTLNTDADALAAGATVTVSGTGTFTSSGTDSFTALTQSGGTVNGTGVLTLSGAFQQSGGTTGGSVDINTATFTQTGGTIASGTTVTSSGAQSLQGGTIAGNLDGAGAITAASGTTGITGTVTNAASLTVSGGTVNLTGAGSVDTSTNAVNVSSGTLSTDGNGIADGETVTVSGTGTLTVTGADTVAVLTQTGGTINGSASLTSSGAFTQSGATTTTGGTVDINAATFTQSGGATIAAGTSVTSSGAQALQGGTIAGTLDGAGAVTVSTGITNLTGAGAITVATSIGINAGGTLTSDGNGITDTATVSNSGTFTITGAETIGGLTGAGTTNLTGANLTTGNASINTFSGTMQGTGGLVVQGTNETALSGTNTFSGGTTINSGTLSLANDGSNLSDTGLVTVNAPGTLLLVGDETIGAVQGSGAVNIFSGVLTTGDASSTTLSGNITGAGSLVKQGAGTFTVSGNVATNATVNAGTLALSGTNTMTSITVDGTGRLRLLSNAAAGGASGQITTTGSVISYGNGVNSATPINLNSNTTQLEVLAADSATQSGIISETGGARPIEKIGTGTLTLSGANTYTGATTVTAGTLNVQNGAAIADNSEVTVASGATFGLLSNEAVGFVTGPGAISLGTSTLTLNGDGDGTSGENFSYAGIISGTGGLTKAGDDRQILSGASTYDGTTSVNAGVLTIQNGTALGSTTGGTVVAPGAALEVQGGITSAENLAISGTGIANGGALRNVSGDNTMSGSIDLVAAARVNSDAGTLTLSGGITGATQNLTVGGAGNTTISGAITTTTGTVTKDGTGTLTLSGANTYTGATTITAGTLIVTSGAALSDTGTVTIANGGTLTVNTNQEFIGNLASSDVATSTAIVNNNAGLVIVGADDTTFDGNISGSAQLTYQGTGSLTLTGTNALTGNLTSSGLGGGNDGTDDGAINITGAGTVASGFIVALDGGTITTDGGALVSNANLIVDGANSSATLTGSETIGALLGNGPGIATTGTVTLTGVGTILTLNGSSPFGSIIGSDVTGTGTLNVTGGTTTVTAAGDVQTATTIGASGAVINNGSMAAVTNAGSFTANDGSNTGALTNTGTADINASTTVTDVASITNNTGGTVTIDGGAAAGQAVDVAGAIDVNAGTVTTTGFVIANTLTNDATVNAQGTLDVDDGTVAFDITNAATGTFNTTAALAGAGSSFENNGTLNVIAGDFTGLSTLTNNEVVNVTGRTLSGTNINNTDRIILTNGQIGGVFNNTGGTVGFNGASTLSSGTLTGGTLDGTNGGTDLDTADSFTLSAGTTLSGATSILNVNSTTQDGDQIIATGATISGGQYIFRELGGVALGNSTTVVVGNNNVLGFTVQNANGSATAFGGAVVYSLVASGSDLALVQETSAGIGGIAAGVSLTQSLIGNVVNRPTSPFASGLAAEEGCSQGGFGRGTIGTASIEGTSTNSVSTRSQSVNADYYGVQAGYDFGCNDGRFFGGGWDAAFGALVGYNSGTTDQPVLVNTGLGVDSVASTTLSDFDQTYVGLYAVASKERLTADVQLRFDNTQFQLSERVSPGFIGLGLSNEPEFDTDTVTFTARLSYQIPLNDKGLAFVPTGGFAYSRTSDASVTFDNGDVLQLDSFTSTVGFIGGTIAKQSVSEDGLSGQAFFGSLNYYNDFGDDRTSTFTSSSGTEEISSSNIGGFGEASIGWNYVRILENGPAGAKQLNANIRADARFGGNVSESYSLTAQVRLSF